jgi:predicted deacylase
MDGRLRDAIGAVSYVEHAADTDGPTVAIVGNLHGDEVTGLFAIHQLDAGLGTLARGRVVLFPTVNPLGLAQRVRTVGAEGGDLNRAFPGDRSGPVAERLAAVVWADLMERKPTIVIDLHADSAQSVPYVLLDRVIDGRIAIETALTAAGGASGLAVVHDYPIDEYRRYNLDRSLTGALVNLAGIPAITIEAGPRRYAEPVAVGIAVAAVRGILASRGMIDGPARESVADDGPWRRSTAWRTAHDGVLTPLVRAGVRFGAGQAIAEVRAADGTLSQRIHADRRGFAMSWPDAAWVTAGSPVGTFAVPDTSESS